MALYMLSSPYPWQPLILLQPFVVEWHKHLLLLVNHEGHLPWHLQDIRVWPNVVSLNSLPANVLPCSRVMLAASLSQFSRINWVNLNIICCLAITLVAAHAGKAFFALSTAAFSSASVLCGTLVTRLFVAGSCNSMKCVVSDCKNWLSRKYGVSLTS